MISPLLTYADARAYLYGLKHRAANYGIDRMRLLVERLGHPQMRYPVVHVAGTNGKGSTCALLESIYRQAGYRTGLFTSPHLVHQGERVQVDRTILSHPQILAYTKRLRPVAEAIEADHPGYHPSFFEFMTAMAFLRFAEAAVDIGIIETGLGGRLDATNVVLPEVSVITSISMDHTEILGDSLAQIAAEKAGIIKPGRPVVSGWLPAEAEAVIERVCRERGCAWYPVKERYGEAISGYPQTGLSCSYQRINAAMASVVVDLLQPRFPVTAAARDAGLLTASWAGRWDRRSVGEGEVVFDASHNPEGIVQLENQLRHLVAERGRKPVIVVGALGQKRAEHLIPVVSRYAAELHLLVPRMPRACSHQQLLQLVPAGSPCKVLCSRVSDIIPAQGQCACIKQAGDVVVATGSIYLIGELLDALENGVPANDFMLQD
jgi:dihydrofolate synthase/folylpolyglutamate synthase